MYQAHAEVNINTESHKVWEALTDPKMVKQYLFGTDMTVSSWQVGGQIRYKGEWEGKPYEDKGEILELDPGKKLVTSYWSGASGKPDVPENYQQVSYEIIPHQEYTRVVITQTTHDSQESADHSANNWKTVLETMKKLLEQ